jgi:hypothetical protein
MTLEAVQDSGEVAEIQSRSRTLAANAANIVVKDDPSAQTATDFLVKVKTALKVAETARKNMTVGIVEAKKHIDEFFKKLTRPYLEAEDTVKAKLRNYHIEQERIRREEEARIASERAEREAAAAEKGEELPPEEKIAEFFFSNLGLTTAPEPMKTVRGMEGGTASMKKVWKFEITDSALIPDEYWVVDEKAIQHAINLGLRDIPGVRIYEDIQVAVRT